MCTSYSLARITRKKCFPGMWMDKDMSTLPASVRGIWLNDGCPECVGANRFHVGCVISSMHATAVLVTVDKNASTWIVRDLPFVEDS
jgi:hypothetical protein